MISKHTKLFITVVCLAALVTGCKRQESSFSKWQRTGEPDVTAVKADDAEMNTAIWEAKQTRQQFLKTLVAPKPNQTDFSVKRPYPTQGRASLEHIWVSALSYDGQQLHGRISDVPVNIPNLKINDPVAFPVEEISDWMFLEDRKIVGGFTIRVLRKHMSAKDGAHFDSHLQFKQ